MKYDYNDWYDQKLHDIARQSTRILDVGGGRPFQKRLAEYRELLRGIEYVTLDIDPSTKPDIVGDAHALPFDDGSFDAVLHSSVLEHLHSPWIAAREMYRVLRPGGCVLGVVPWIYPYHAREGHYHDYWRFTQDGLQRLFADFRTIELQKMGRWWQTGGLFLPGYWRIRSFVEPMLYVFDRCISPNRSTTPFHGIWACK
jgi:ubiquinone/menaquinone biosynthesis C-methylase UbiE